MVESGLSFCLIGKDCLTDGIQYRYGVSKNNLSISVKDEKRSKYAADSYSTLWNLSLNDESDNERLVTPVTLAFKKSFFFFDIFSYQPFFDFSAETVAEGWMYAKDGHTLNGNDTYGYISQQYISVGLSITTELKWFPYFLPLSLFLADTDNTFRWFVVGIGGYYTLIVSKGKVEECKSASCRLTTVYNFDNQHTGPGAIIEFTLLEYNGDGFELLFGKVSNYITFKIPLSDELFLDQAKLEVQYISFSYLF